MTYNGDNLRGLTLLSRTTAEGKSHFMVNGHGDVTALTDSAGSLIATYYYDAFGNHKSVTGTADNPYRYSGYMFDEASGLYYLKARFYDPELARFLQEDTYRGSAGDPLSLNLYAYCSNNPVRYWDPSGHWQETTVDGAGHEKAGDDRYLYDVQLQLITLTSARYYASDVLKDPEMVKAIDARVKYLRENNKKSGNSSDPGGLMKPLDDVKTWFGYYLHTVNGGKALSSLQWDKVLENSKISITPKNSSGRDYSIWTFELSFVKEYQDRKSTATVTLSTSGKSKTATSKANIVKYTPSSSGGAGGGSGGTTTPSTQRINDNGINFIANLEVYSGASYMHYDGDKLIGIDKHGVDLGYGYDLNVYPNEYKSLLGITDGRTTLTAEEALLLLKWELETHAKSIIDYFGNIFTQNQLTALVSLGFNMGSLGKISGFLDALARGNYRKTEFDAMIKGYYRGLVDKNPNNAKYLDGWLARTDKMLNLFFDNQFGDIGIDAVKGRKSK